MFRQAFLTGTPVNVVRDAVPIRIGRARLGGTAGFGRACILGAEVVGVGNAVAVPVRAASVLAQTPLRRTVIIQIGHPVTVTILPTPGHRAAIGPRKSRFSRTVIIAVAYPIAIAVWATISQGRSTLVGALVFRIRDAVAVPVCGAGGGAPVPRGGANRTWFFRASIVLVGDSVAVGIGAALGHQRASLIRALVIVIGDPVEVSIVCHGTAVIVQQARFVRTGIFAVGHPISISVGAALSQGRAGLIRADVQHIGHPIPILVRAFHSLHVDRGVGMSILRVEGPDD
jgi:hypothetical protein